MAFQKGFAHFEDTTEEEFYQENTLNHPFIEADPCILYIFPPDSIKLNINSQLHPFPGKKEQQQKNYYLSQCSLEMSLIPDLYLTLICSEHFKTTPTTE